MQKTAAKAFPIERIRADFPLLQTEMNGKPLVFLDSAASSQKPQQVLDAIEQYYAHDNANVHRGVYALSQNATDAFESARRTMATYINAPEEHEVIWVRGCTEGINLVASTYGQRFKAGDEIIVSHMEHHSNIVPWQMLCERTGAQLKVIPVSDSGELDMAAYAELLSERTVMVSVVHVSNALGTVNPVVDICKMAHEVGAVVLVDGAQATPHGTVDVQAIGCDFYTFSGHKMCGPTGQGILWGRRKLLESMPPYHGGGEMIDKVSFEGTTYNVIPFKFEAGTPNIAGAVGLAAAADYMTSLDLTSIEAYESELLDYATAEMSKIEGLKVIGTASEKHSVLSFLVEGMHPYDLGTLLDKQGVAVRTGHHCCQPLMERFGIPGTVRASFAFYNTHEDVDRLVAATTRAVKMLS
ncbi:MAG: aminotransferase class V-fold PLP-dependent enzyme [Saprospiraceae bacterium]